MVRRTQKDELPSLAERRRIDWSVILPDNPPVVRLARPTTQSSQLATWTSEAIANPSAETADRFLFHAVEFCKTVIHLERCGIFLLDSDNHAMVGTWGTGAEGEMVDEHQLAYEYGPLDREIFARAQAGFPWTVYEDCPLIAQCENATRILGRGWVACTPIRGPEGPIGIMFSDTALSHAPIDEAKQARAAILCALLGQALEPCRSHLVQASSPRRVPRHPVVRGVTTLLVHDPTLSCDAMAEQLHVSARHLARVFKREAGTSVVDHRNELRLARFLDRVDAEAHNLLEAALDAGFGSYAQFHRVFRARLGRTPREYLLERKGGPR